MPNEQKRQEVSELRELISRAEAMILADYRGLTVAEMEELRNKMREQGLQFRVVKNRLAIKAFDNLGLNLSEAFRGKCGVIMAEEEGAISVKPVVVTSTRSSSRGSLSWPMPKSVSRAWIEPSRFSSISTLDGLMSL